MLALLVAPPALGDDEVHWLGEGRFLIRYRERNTKDVAAAIAEAREKAAALCQLRGAASFAIDEDELRERLREEFREMSVDVVLFDEPPGAATVPPDGYAAVRPCTGEADRKALASIAKALRKAGIEAPNDDGGD
ncbi:MAG: hypothetical protein DWQ36_03525 [Acidobacteria bacterium]|nr:MAG: hypothetical protein DWQ30_13005 [Acidobacteriota bacterium]REK10666.1 MAG: hypothetical protein DWQ36_03525 [Acidobacteriota bacterium]